MKRLLVVLFGVLVFQSIGEARIDPEKLKDSPLFARLDHAIHRFSGRVTETKSEVVELEEQQKSIEIAVDKFSREVMDTKYALTDLEEQLEEQQKSIDALSGSISTTDDEPDLRESLRPGVLPDSAQTIVPAGVLTGTTTVTFGDDDDTPTQVDTDISVSLVPSAPLLLEPTDQHSFKPDEPVTYQYTIRATSNGQDEYTLKAEVTSDNLDGASDTVTIEPNKVTLGVTAVLKAASTGESSVTVPSDGKADAVVNGIESGDMVLIKVQTYKVVSVDDDGESATIKLTRTGGGGGLADDVTVGVPIYEWKTFDVVLDSVGKQLDEAKAGEVTIKITAQVAEKAELFHTDTTITKVLKLIEPSFQKYVRNTNDARNPMTDEQAVAETDNKKVIFWEYDSQFYFNSTSSTDKDDAEEFVVKALPGDSLEYLVVVRAGNQSDLENLKVVEKIPPFVIVDWANSSHFSPNLTDWKEEGGEFTLTFEPIPKGTKGFLYYSGQVLAEAPGDKVVAVGAGPGADDRCWRENEWVSGSAPIQCLANHCAQNTSDRLTAAIDACGGPENLGSEWDSKKEDKLTTVTCEASHIWWRGGVDSVWCQ